MSHAWFYGAPVTKAVVFSTCASSMYALRLASRPDDFIGSMGLNASRVLASGELWRLVTCHLPFASTSELLLGLSFLYEMHKFERMMGSGKFGAFVVFVTSLAASLQAAASRTFESLRAPSTGPYSLIFAVLMLHHAFVPPVKPRVMRILGVDFSNKAPFYILALPVSAECSSCRFRPSRVRPRSVPSAVVLLLEASSQTLWFLTTHWVVCSSGNSHPFY